MILRGNIYSSFLKMDTGITILSPNAVEESGAYKVVYLLHGLYGDHESWVNNTMLPVYANDYDAVFVMPEAGRSYYTDMKYGYPYFSYLTEELPKIVKSIFNISSKREDTIVIGGSMGGYGALKCALNYPWKYGVCCALSAACLFLGESLEKANQSGVLDCNDFKIIFGDTLTSVSYTHLFYETVPQRLSALFAFFERSGGTTAEAGSYKK